MLLLALGGLLASCEKAVIDEASSGEDQLYTISLSMGGEYLSVSEEPLSRAGGEGKLYAVNVSCKKSGAKSYAPYAYGLFSQPDDMVVQVRSGNLYKFECTIVREEHDALYHDGDSYLAPFLHGDDAATTLSNAFVYDTEESLSGLDAGTTNLTATETTNYPRMYRYYGTLEDFDPSASTRATIDMRKAVFGLHFVATPPADGSITVESWLGTLTLSATDEPCDREDVYTFNQVAQAIKDGYNGNIKLTLTWNRGDGTVVTDTKTINVKRNVMTTITINTQSSSKNATFALQEEESGMTEESTDWTITD